MPRIDVRARQQQVAENRMAPTQPWHLTGGGDVVVGDIGQGPGVDGRVASS
jgi:hypothetical protein